MNPASVWVLLGLAFIAANLPWLSNRIFFVLAPKSGVKSWQWRLLEWLLLYFVVGFLAIGMERATLGNVHPQSWEFYAVTFFLFAVFAFPGFIYRFNLRDRAGRT